MTLPARPRFRRFLVLMAALPAVASAAVAAPAPDPVFAHPATVAQMTEMLAPTTRALASAAAVRGRFEQRSFLQGLPQPLQSSGTFLVARGLGVDWHTLKPFDAETILTATALVQRSADGGRQTFGADHQPGLAAVERTFDALFTLDLGELKERFDLYGEQHGATWTLGLKPRDATLAAHLQAVVIAGGDHPRQVTLYQAGGDRTGIRFDDVVVETGLSATQRRLFQP